MILFCDECKEKIPKPVIYASLDGTKWLCEKHRQIEMRNEQKENRKLSTGDITEPLIRRV